MPLVSNRDIGAIQQLPEVAETTSIAPSTGEVFGAAFRQENSLVSLATNETSFQDYQTEEGFDPFDGDNLKGYEMFAESFIDAKSSAHGAAKKQQIDNQLQDRKTVADGGFMGFTAMIAAGGTDPLFWLTMAIPGGAGIRGSKTALEAAVKVGAIGGVSEIPAEAAKQYTQETRTDTDAMFAIGGATILSGILGGAVKGLSNSEVSSIAAKIDSDMSDADTPMVDGNARSMGAAETVTLSKEELTPVSVGGMETWGVSPNLRLESSPSIKSRQIVADMMESATVKQAHIDGKATMPDGGSAETRIKAWDAGLGQSLLDLDSQYTKYRGDKVNVPIIGGTATKTKRMVNDYVMRNRAGKMTLTEFKEEAGRVARRNDKSDIPEVQAVAESFRKNIIDPMKDAAIREKLLSPDVDVTTAASYLTRVYKTKRIAAKRDEWDGVVEGWLDTQRKSAKLLDDPSDIQIAEGAMTDLEIKQIAEDITAHITGVASGRSPYDSIKEPWPLILSLPVYTVMPTWSRR